MLGARHTVYYMKCMKVCESMNDDRVSRVQCIREIIYCTLITLRFDITTPNVALYVILQVIIDTLAEMISN